MGDDDPWFLRPWLHGLSAATQERDFRNRRRLIYLSEQFFRAAFVLETVCGGAGASVRIGHYSSGVLPKFFRRTIYKCNPL
jgi:hypothetical protein